MEYLIPYVSGSGGLYEEQDLEQSVQGGCGGHEGDVFGMWRLVVRDDRERSRLAKLDGHDDENELETDYQARRHIMSLSPQNTASIQAIESAILLVCLDGAQPKNDDGRAWSYWSGGLSSWPEGQGWNRWFDKHQLIVDEAGETGFNGEREFDRSVRGQ